MKTILRASLVLAALSIGSAAWAEESAAAEPGADARPEPAVAASSESKARADDAVASPTEAKPDQATPAADAPKAEHPQLVEGAPLGNANVYVHSVQKKSYTNEGRHELVLYPAVLQVNGKFSQHYGLGLMYAYHLFENLAIQLTPIWNYWNQESDFNQELIEKGHQRAEAATALLLQYGGTAGVEVTPVYGKFALYESTLVHFSFVINAGVGAGSTRVQLVERQTGACEATGQCRSAAFGDTGARFLGSVGAGFRLFLGERAAIRIEVRDLIYTARIDRVNGCDADDIAAIKTDDPPLSGSCNAGAFVEPTDVQQALTLVRTPSSDVVNNVSFYAGFSFLF